MAAKNINDWNDANQRYLMASLKLVQLELEQALPDGGKGAAIVGTHGNRSSQVEAEMEAALENLPMPSALDTLVDALNLSDFEKKIILSCAGVELDGNFGKLV